MSPRFSFKSNVAYDIALLTETESVNPFVFKVRKYVWAEIASNLQKSDLKMPVNERSCRERVTLLLEEFSKDEKLSRKASGIDEANMSELKTILTRVKELSVESIGPAKSLYNKKDRQEAEKTREAALAEIESMDSSDDIYEESSSSPKISEDLTVDEEEEPPAKKSQRIKKGNVISYLQQKQEIETGLKKEELLLMKLEAENRLLELTLAKEKQEMDFKIKQAELKMQQQAQNAQNEERCTLTKALIEVISKRQDYQVHLCEWERKMSIALILIIKSEIE